MFYDQGSVIIPVINSIVMVPIPCKLKFEHIKNGKMLSYSREYDS